MKPIPATPKTFCADQDTWFMALVAVRYCIGRRSYAPSLADHWIRRHWSLMPPHTRAMIRRDVCEEVARAESCGRLDFLGDECDQTTWLNLREWLTSRPSTDYCGAP